VIKILNGEDERLLHLLIDSTVLQLAEQQFSISSLEKSMGMSRSQLYRKITNLTGRSANNFIRELRLQKALQLIRNRYGNITQIALETGFNNPSYFAKNFLERFGLTPFDALKKCS
jgi:AraC-like DNA-binding protein